MDLIKLEIHGISYSENLSGAFALVLNESKGQRKLPVVIGGFEAQAIALALQKNISVQTEGLVLLDYKILGSESKEP